MENNKPKFNLQRFLWLIIPFTMVAALMIYMKPREELEFKPRPFPLYNLKITSKASKGTIILNGISINAHKSDEETRDSVISLTPWLVNGENTLYISNRNHLENTTQQFKASLEIIPREGPAKEQSLKTAENGELEKLIIWADSLPEWSWLKGSPSFHDNQEVLTAVRDLHKAFINKDQKLIQKIEQPLFQDMEKLTGRSGLERREYRAEIIRKGTVEPLGKLLIVPFDNGRIMRVTKTDGEAPIRVYYKYGNGGKVILTGRFWSKINGEWHVVR